MQKEGSLHLPCSERKLIAADCANMKGYRKAVFNEHLSHHVRIKILSPWLTKLGQLPLCMMLDCDESKAMRH
jgi:hypothetical protein